MFEKLFIKSPLYVTIIFFISLIALETSFLVEFIALKETEEDVDFSGFLPKDTAAVGQAECLRNCSVRVLSMLQ